MKWEGGGERVEEKERRCGSEVKWERNGEDKWRKIKGGGGEKGLVKKLREGKCNRKKKRMKTSGGKEIKLP